MRKLEEINIKLKATATEVDFNERRKVSLNDLIEFKKRLDQNRRPYTVFDTGLNVRQNWLLEPGSSFVDFDTKTIFIPMDGAVFKMLFSHWPNDRMIDKALFYASEIVEFKLRQIYSKHGI